MEGKREGKAVLGNWEEGDGIPRNRDRGEGADIGVVEGGR